MDIYLSIYIYIYKYIDMSYINMYMYKHTHICLYTNTYIYAYLASERDSETTAQSAISNGRATGRCPPPPKHMHACMHK